MSSRTSDLHGAAWRLCLLLALAAPLFCGCISMEVPKDFLVLEKGTSSFKAVSPEEARIWVRKFKDPLEGDLTFWSGVLRQDFVTNRGYTLVEERDVKGPEDRDSHESIFETMVQGVPHRYLVSVFIVEGWLWFSNKIYVTEFVAEKTLFEKDLEEVRKAILTVEP
jgi:hypothetical protein